jgi:hypothetical protein
MSATIAWVPGVLLFLLHPKRLLTLIAGFFAGVAYVWVASVRAVPGVRRRKAARRAAWRARRRRYDD